MTDKTTNDGGGLRKNEGKINLSYCPVSIIAGIALGFQKNSEAHGGKYPDNNWRRGMKWSVPFNCMLRHLFKWWMGADIDEETGLPHLYLVGCNLAMLIEYSTTYKEGDDRFKGPTRTLNDLGKTE